MQLACTDGTHSRANRATPHPACSSLRVHASTYPAARGLQLLPAQKGVAVNQFSFASNCDADLPALT